MSSQSPCHSGTTNAIVAALAIALLALIPAAHAQIVFNTDTYIAPDNLTYENEDIIVDGATLTIDGPHTFNSLAVINSAIVTHSPNSATPEFAIDLNIITDLTVELDATINVTGKGYPSASGPGAGQSGGTFGGGGGHGGHGADSSEVAGGSPYGNVDAPLTLGSGGGRGQPYEIGGAGGGGIRLQVNGTTTINGEVRADGQPGGVQSGNYGGGGAGGSIWITTDALAGEGLIRAAGGDAQSENAGAGAGGRITVEYANSTFSGGIEACGANSATVGGAGTIYTHDTTNNTTTLRLSNCAAGAGAGALTPVSTPTTLELLITDNARAYATDTLALTNLTIDNGGLLTHPQGGPALDIDVAADATIATGASIDVAGKGYTATQGPGAGVDGGTHGGGAGHGGNGGNSSEAAGGPTNDDIVMPADFGSGGGNGVPYTNGGSGGGSVNLNVAGTLTLHGTINADGGDGNTVSGNNGGGGAGGTINISADFLTGAGLIQANGGDAPGTAGGGAAGRVAIHYSDTDFSGDINLCGGSGYQPGAAGTFVLFLAENEDPDLAIRNCGQVGAVTELLPPLPDFRDVVIGDNAITALAAGETLQMENLSIINGAVFTHTPSETDGVILQIAQNLLIDDQSRIDIAAKGFPPAAGPGAGESNNTAGAGAAHGGHGGNSGYNAGGQSYGDPFDPNTLGSGGGRETDGTGNAGRGGGAIRISVDSHTTLSGQINANGQDASGSTGSDHGGGAGGTVYIHTTSLTGSGYITANGGNGNATHGGGGAGGRIALYAQSSDFTGSLTACPGSGYQNAGAGTIYTQLADTPTLRIDGCATAEAITTLPDVDTIPGNLTVTDTAILEHTGLLHIDNELRISGDATLTHPLNDTGLQLEALNATIESDARLDVSARGFPAREGPGAGQSDNASGGGGAHGGTGGDALTTMGGTTYGDFVNPTQFGSGGGEETDGANGGPGGGAITLTILETLAVDGELRADGRDGLGSTGQDNGGGAGGTIHITTQSLTGNGAISANGGNGNATYGGGGGGGRIAIRANTYNFQGTLNACPGLGYNNAGPGTIYVESDTTNGLFVDACGYTGAETNLPGADTIPTNLFVQNAATLVLTNPLEVQGNALLDDNATVTQQAESNGVGLYVTGDCTITADSALDISGRGFPPRSGPGAGQSSSSSGGGAGHGGRGGDGLSVVGGQSYGSTHLPTEPGSGGGAETDTGGNPGPGGGALTLIVDGMLHIDGSLRANGHDATGGSGRDHGGGAGGSLLIKAATLAGAGSISADGGSASAGQYGGGGAGGRIAIYSCDIQFAPSQVSVSPGIGYNDGQPGTIFYGSLFIEFTLQPTGGIAFVGQPYSFQADAYSDLGPITYQWRRNGTDLTDDGHYAGTQTDTLSIDELTLADAGVYDVLVQDDCGALLSEPATLIVPPPGDLNCDGIVDNFDIDAFVLVLTNPDAYAAQYPDCDPYLADLDGDGLITNFDIDPFVALLTGK